MRRPEPSTRTPCRRPWAMTARTVGSHVASPVNRTTESGPGGADGWAASPDSRHSPVAYPGGPPQRWARKAPTSMVTPSGGKPRNADATADASSDPRSPRGADQEHDRRGRCGRSATPPEDAAGVSAERPRPRAPGCPHGPGPLEPDQGGSGGLVTPNRGTRDLDGPTIDGRDAGRHRRRDRLLHDLLGPVRLSTIGKPGRRDLGDRADGTGIDGDPLVEGDRSGDRLHDRRERVSGRFMDPEHQEPAVEGAVRLDVATVLVVGGRRDERDVAAGEDGLDEAGQSAFCSCPPAPSNVVSSSANRIARVARASSRSADNRCSSRPYVPLSWTSHMMSRAIRRRSRQPLRDRPSDDACREALHERGLAVPARPRAAGWACSGGTGSRRSVQLGIPSHDRHQRSDLARAVRSRPAWSSIGVARRSVSGGWDRRLGGVADTDVGGRSGAAGLAVARALRGLGDRSSLGDRGVGGFRGADRTGHPRRSRTARHTCHCWIARPRDPGRSGSRGRRPRTGSPPLRHRRLPAAHARAHPARRCRRPARSCARGTGASTRPGPNGGCPVALCLHAWPPPPPIRGTHPRRGSGAAGRRHSVPSDPHPSTGATPPSTTSVAARTI